MKPQILIFTILLLTNMNVFAVTNYSPYNSPPQNIILGDPYNPDTNRFNTQNNLNPYSTFQDPYNPESARNSEKYEQKLYSETGEFQGNVSIYVTNANSNTNPYSPSGNEFNSQNALYNYNPNNAKYLYNVFQQPYSNQSVWNNPRYSTQLIGNDKHSMGALQPPSYNNDQSALNPYGPKGDEFNAGNDDDPYYYYYYINNYE